MKIDHIGYAVKDIDKARETFETLGFSFEQLFEDTDRNLLIQFGEKDGYRIELLAVLNKDKESPIDSYLHSIGPTMYHFCYSTDNLNEEIERLKLCRYLVICEPSKAIAFNNKRVVFLINRNIGLIELVESN